MKKAAMINAVGKYTTVILQLVVNAVLSRLLSPDDYGIVAVITVFSTFFIMLSDMGFSTAVVQHKDLSEDDLNKIFSFTLYVAVALMLLFCGLSFIIAGFYQNNVYVKLGPMLSVALFFNALNMVPNGIMNRNKKFGSIAFRTVVACLIAAGIAIGLAYVRWKYYAIVVQTVTSSFIIFVWNFFETKPRFDFKQCFGSVKKIIDYSSYQFAFNIVNYFSRNLDNLLTGKFFGNAELGYYNKAYTLMLYPVNNLAGVITPVVHPMLSDYQDKKDYIYGQYVKLVKILFIGAAYIAPFCYLASSEVIGILFGNQWNSSVRCFQFLCLAILPQFIGSPTGAIYQSIGKTKLLFYNAILNTAITIFAILTGVFVGKNIVVLSACVAVSYILHFFTTNFMLINIGFKQRLTHFLRKLLKETGVLAICIVAVVVYPFSFENIFISTVAKGLYLGLFYIVGLFVTGIYKDIFQVLKKRKNKWK